MGYYWFSHPSPAIYRGVNLGEELDNGGDPPRVWAPGKTFPGCAFTRSIGDNVAEAIGVNAEPELLRKVHGLKTGMNGLWAVGDG
jgi:hypothetical protein